MESASAIRAEHALKAASSRRWVGHPGVCEAPASAFETSNEVDKNPPLRGIILSIVASFVGASDILQRLLFHNAKFDRPVDLPGINKLNWRFSPTVIPLREAGDKNVGITADLLQTQPLDLAGRFHSAADYYEAYKSGEVTPLHVADALLPFIRKDGQQSSKYSLAFIQVRPDEVLAAAKASTERWATGKAIGPLDGVPFAVKDDIEVQGWVTTMGMKVTNERYFKEPGTRTEWPVLQMLKQGAMMMGRLNQHEAGLDTHGCNNNSGTPVNWANPAYYPGGSSSGAGSAISGGLIPIGLATDAGGSIRLPASFCGVYGLKTSQDRTVVLKASMCIISSMASTVDDLVLSYRIMSEADPNDPVTSLFAPSMPPSPSAKKYVGVYWDWIRQSDPEVLDIFEKMLGHMTTRLGYEMIDMTLPYVRDGQWAHGASCLAESADHAVALTCGDPRKSKWLGFLSPANAIMVAIGSQTNVHQYIKYSQLRQAMMSHLAFLFQKYPGLLMLTPATPLVGWPINKGDQAFGFIDGNKSLRNMAFAYYANMTGIPAVSCPAGYFTPELGRGRLPVGVMAMGEWGAEEQLLAFARETEQYLNGTWPGGRFRPEGWVDIVDQAKKLAKEK